MRGETDPNAEGPLEPLILAVRGQRVILDADLARLYGVTTKALNQAVKRNIERFPQDFAFQLSIAEAASIKTLDLIEEKSNRSQIVTGSKRHRNPRQPPRAFTEHGALMAANVLRSERAVQMSIFVIRAFVRLREQVAANAAILKRLAEIDQTLLQHDAALRDVYRKLQPLLAPPAGPSKRRIGF
jgi:hypothetical protein